MKNDGRIMILTMTSVPLSVWSFFVRGLTPPALKQKAHQISIEKPAATWQQLMDRVATKDLSFSVSSEFTGTASCSIDNKIDIEG